mmetsp:Transcript_9518/g.22430  ORF Transcript_9518/g.22430 Transcript_9518/m.22430 type:complete len:218 (+) Transcript_9518:1337-1990(+)
MRCSWASMALPAVLRSRGGSIVSTGGRCLPSSMPRSRATPMNVLKKFSSSPWRSCGAKLITAHARGGVPGSVKPTSLPRSIILHEPSSVLTSMLTSRPLRGHLYSSLGDGSCRPLITMRSGAVLRPNSAAGQASASFPPLARSLTIRSMSSKRSDGSLEVAVTMSACMLGDMARGSPPIRLKSSIGIRTGLVLFFLLTSTHGRCGYCSGCCGYVSAK